MIEVTAAEDQKLASQQGAIQGERGVLRDSRLRVGWFAHLAEGVDVKRAKRMLPDILAAFEKAGIEEIDFYGVGLEEDLDWAVARLRDARVAAVKASLSDAGTIYLSGSLWTGFMSVDPESVVRFVEEFVSRRHSDVAKLVESGADERHLFIWSGYYSEGVADLRALGRDVGHLPERAPKLPGGVTHVWVAMEGARPSRIVHWSPDRGWAEVAPPAA